MRPVQVCQDPGVLPRFVCRVDRLQVALAVEQGQETTRLPEDTGVVLVGGAEHQPARQERRD